MSNFYIDPVNGNDANDGLGPYKAAFTSGGTAEIAVGDTVTGATSGKAAKVAHIVVSSGTWASGSAAGTLYVGTPDGAFTDGENLNVSGKQDNIATLTANFAISSWKTWTLGATAARIAPGDTIMIAKSPDEVDSGIDATFTNKSSTITLASSLTKEICDCDSAWTVSANVTPAQNILRPSEGTGAQKLTIASGFSTGKIAYFSFATANFSSYQKVSFAICSSVDLAAGVLQLCLCSDATGATAVDSLTINVPISYDSLTERHWTSVTIDKGSALGSSIRSVALYALSDPGTPAINIDNIIACNGLTLNSLVGPSGNAVYPIINMVGTTITLGIMYYGQLAFDYDGESTTDNLYYRNPIPAPVVVAALTTTCEKTMDSGTSGNIITYAGGWNFSSLSRDGMTFYDGLNGLGYGIEVANASYLKLSNLAYVRVGHSVMSTSFSNNVELDTIFAIGNSTRGIYLNKENTTGMVLSGTIKCIANNGTGLAIGYAGSIITIAKLVSTATIHIRSGNGQKAMVINGYEHRFEGTITLSGDAGPTQTLLDIDTAFNLYIKKLIFECSGSSTQCIKDYGGACNTIEEVRLDDDVYYLFYDTYSTNCRIGYLDLNATIATLAFYLSSFYKTFNIYRGYSIDNYNASNRWKTQRPFGYISDQVTGGQAEAWAYGGEGTCLYFDPSSETGILPYVFYAHVSAGTTYQLHFYVKKTSSAANCTLEIDRISGCGITEIKDEAVSLTDSWAEHTSANFTPTMSGFIRIEFHALDGSTTGDIGVDNIHLASV